MEEFKSLNKYLNKNKNKDKVNFSSEIMCIRGFISRILICLILFLVFAIGVKSFDGFSSFIYRYVYSDTFLFSSFRLWYDEKFGVLFPKEGLYGVVPVFNESLTYSSLNLYKDGVLLNVDNNYLVPSLNEGVVVFIGDKNEYGSCVIVQQTDGVNAWYCNIDNSSFEMYDYINDGEFVGEVNGKELYLVFEQNGEFLDYKKYI